MVGGGAGIRGEASTRKTKEVKIEFHARRNKLRPTAANTDDNGEDDFWYVLSVVQYS